MSFLFCFDKFKSCITAEAAGGIVADKLRTLIPRKDVLLHNLPLSDGGDGFLSTLSDIMNLNVNSLPVHHLHDQLLKNDILIDAPFGIGVNPSTNERFAVLEMAKCAGLELLTHDSLKNPENTTTYGLGQLIKYVHDSLKINKILLGVGGSATNDCGLGALQAMGLSLMFDEKEQKQRAFFPENVFFGKDLNKLRDISLSSQVNCDYEGTCGCMPEGRKLVMDGLQIDIAVDVANTTTGPEGAVHVFSKQKGAKTEKQREILENGMKNACKIIQKKTGVDIEFLKGGGAAGGIAGGFYALQDAKLKPGIELVSEYVALEDKIKNSTAIFTGEGAYDAQTLSGKVVSHVEKLCEKHNKPCFIICGKNELKNSSKSNVFDLISLAKSEELSMKNPKPYIEQIVEKIYKENLEKLIKMMPPEPKQKKVKKMKE